MSLRCYVASLALLFIANANLPKDEADALVALGNTVGFGGRLSRAADFCNSTGVTCDAGHVTELFYDRVQRLPDLPHLDVAVCNLTRLKKLTITRCRLAGSIPACIGSSLPLLERLHLFNNELTGDLPTSLCSLKNLKGLHLARNTISGTFFDCFGQMSNVNSINLGINMIGGTLPANLPPSLTSFKVGVNNLFGEIPAGFGRIANLRQLVLADNPRINGSIPTALGELRNTSKLEFFDLAGTGVSGTIPANLALFPLLRVLRVERTRITVMPASMNCDVSSQSQPLFGCFCPIGTYKIVNASGVFNCVPCELNRYSEFIHADRCSPCPSGTMTLEERTTSAASCVCIRGTELSADFGTCDACKVGYEGSVPAQCTRCEVGRYSPRIRSLLCHSCNPGSYQGLPGQSNCEICVVGRFQSLANSSSCELCAHTFTTDTFGATSLSDCVCPKGTHFDELLGACESCPKYVFCPGGFAQNATGEDTTPFVEEGFMSLRSDPLSIYKCVGGARRCPRLRSPFGFAVGSMCPKGFARLPQCAVCENGFFLTQNACERCSVHWWEDNLFRPLSALIIELLFVGYMYKRWNRPNPPGMVAVGLCVAFYQYVMAIGSLPLKWPEVFDTFFNLLRFGTMSVAYPLIRPPCIVGNGYQWRLLTLTLSPLLLVFYLGVLYVGARVFGIHLNVNYIKNNIGIVFHGLFIVITRIALMLFLVEAMPNGLQMVQQIPELEFGSEEWLLVLPIGIGAFCVYNCTFLAYVTQAVVRAPKLAATDPYFMHQYRFAFGILRPDRWWWTLLTLVFGVLLNLIQVLSRNVQLQLYLSILLFVTFSAMEFRMQPFTFRAINVIDLCLKYSLITFLVLATAFIDMSNLSKEELNANADLYTIVMGCVIFTPALVILMGVGHWLFTTFNPEYYSVGRAARIVFGFRDVMAAQLLLSDREVLSRIGRVSETDLHTLIEARNAVLATLLGEQPGSSLQAQRLLPGVAFKVWNEAEMAEHVLRSVQTSQLQQSVERNFEARVLLLKLAQDLQDHDWKGTAPLKKHSTKSLQKAFGLEKSLTSSQFIQSFEGITQLTENQLRATYDLLDVDESGGVSLREFIMTIKSLGSIPNSVNSWASQPGVSNVLGRSVAASTRSITASADNLHGVSQTLDLNDVSIEETHPLAEDSRNVIGRPRSRSPFRSRSPWTNLLSL